MSATVGQPTAPPRTRRGGRGARLAPLERPLLAAGLALVAAHLLDLALSGPATASWGVLGIVSLPAAWYGLQPRLIRPTRFALALLVGLLALGFGVISHGLHTVNNGPDWRDLTGLAMIAGGVLLLASSAAALRRTQPRGLHPSYTWSARPSAPSSSSTCGRRSARCPQVLHAPRWAVQ